MRALRRNQITVNDVKNESTYFSIDKLRCRTYEMWVFRLSGFLIPNIPNIAKVCREVICIGIFGLPITSYDYSLGIVAKYVTKFL